MALPNFFIVGAAKCGTTSLYCYMKQHPEVFMSPVKEPHYFSGLGKVKDDLIEYEALFSAWNGEIAIGEASTSYLYSEQAFTGIKRLLPDAKIIIILRNPTLMAHALWRQNFRKGDEPLSFPDALKEEEYRMSDPSFQLKGWPANYYYFDRAMYSRQVKRYLEAFSLVRVFIFEEFAKDPIGTCREIFRFLEVDPSFEPVIEIHNEERRFRYAKMQKLLTRPPSSLARLGGALPDGLVSPIRKFLLKLNSKPAPRLEAKLKEQLTERYYNDVKELEKLIGRDLSHWYAKEELTQNP